MWVCHHALPTLPAGCEENPPRGAQNCRVPKTTCLVSRLCDELFLWGERGTVVLLRWSCDEEEYQAPYDLVLSAPSASWAAVSFCQCEVSVLWAGTHQRPSECVRVCHFIQSPLTQQLVPYHWSSGELAQTWSGASLLFFSVWNRKWVQIEAPLLQLSILFFPKMCLFNIWCVYLCVFVRIITRVKTKL